MVNREQPLWGPAARKPGSLSLFRELGGLQSTKIHNSNDRAVTKVVCRDAYLKKKKNTESGIVKFKLLLTSDVELHKNSLPSQISTTGGDLLLLTALSNLSCDPCQSWDSRVGKKKSTVL